MFRYVRSLCGDGAERFIPPDLRLRTIYAVELACCPERPMVRCVEGLRGQLEEVASKAVASARWPAGPARPIHVRRLRYDLDAGTDLPVPETYREAPIHDSG